MTKRNVNELMKLVESRYAQQKARIFNPGQSKDARILEVIQAGESLQVSRDFKDGTVVRKKGEQMVVDPAMAPLVLRWAESGLILPTKEATDMRLYKSMTEIHDGQVIPQWQRLGRAREQSRQARADLAVAEAALARAQGAAQDATEKEQHEEDLLAELLDGEQVVITFGI
jgi:hypothetical protein